MPDLHDLLERTTPADLPAVDVGAIARTARHRQRRRRASTALAAVVVVGVVGAGIGLAAGGPEPGGGQDVRSDVATAPDTRTLTEGMGTWSQLPDTPWPGAGELAPVGDGGLLAWGFDIVGFRSPTDPVDRRLRLAVLEPGASSWRAIDGPPGFDLLQFGDLLDSVQVVGDRILALGRADDGVLRGAVHDLGDGTWTTVPDLPDVLVQAEALAWDGETLAVVRTSPGSHEAVSDHDAPHAVFDEETEAELSAHSTVIDWRVAAPLVRRWTYGADRWQDGAAPPLSLRITAGTAFDGARLAVVGGTEGATGTDDATRTRADGAVYDVAADAWTTLPDLPWAATHPSVGWVDGRLVVAGGSDDLEGMEPDPFPRSVRLAVDGATWEELPPSPEAGAGLSWRSSFERQGEGQPVVQRSSNLGQGGVEPSRVLVDGAWEPTPTGTLHRWDGLLVATSDEVGNPGDLPFIVQVRRGPDQWVDAAAAPFANRMRPGVAVVGDRVYVVGGLAGRAVTPDASAWVLDLSATR